jgi:EAL domain-containing protein (putative c-di-GMP-specific phosphodiesterase class I)/DICT domain-containing protein
VDVLPAVLENNAVPVGSAAANQRPVSWTIDKIIEERAIRTLFQPIVHLETKAIVGFEALTRGPEGSELESPIALLEAAAAAGRLGELDWLCRVTALQAAAASGLPTSLAWFVNVEPASLQTPCPDYLLPEFTRASANLRVIFEFVERDIEENVTALLNAADDVRNSAWGVALDDVGAVDGSLAMMPLVQPDVVKLDRCLVENAGDAAATAVIAAVLAHAERHNAGILAEGIETADEEAVARAFGAEYGQGYLYGRPGPLPENVPTLREVVPIRQLVAPVDDATPFEALATQLPARNAAESEISYIGAWLHQQAASAENPGLALANFHDTQWANDHDWHTLKQVIGSNALTLIVAGDVPDYAEANLRTHRRHAAHPLSREWVIIVLQAHFAAAFAARNKGGWSAEKDLEFDYVLTHDRELAATAARALLQGIGSDATRWLARREDAAEESADTVAAEARSDHSADSVRGHAKPRLLRFRNR